MNARLRKINIKDVPAIRQLRDRGKTFADFCKEINKTRPIDESCPSDSFELGTPDGTCWGDGHYMCKECVNYRPDFAMHGQEYIDAVHNRQSGIIIQTLKADSK